MRGGGAHSVCWNDRDIITAVGVGGQGFLGVISN